jgi:hypothetical protein
VTTAMPQNKSGRERGDGLDCAIKVRKDTGARQPVSSEYLCGAYA